MSGTPQTDDIARGNHVVPVEWAEHLERERDEARDILQAVIKTGKRLERERDEAREKYDNLATEHMLSINKICNERDEAREHLDNMQGQRDFAMKVIKRLEQERDEARKYLKWVLDVAESQKK